jgi:hypothetical protein
MIKGAVILAGGLTVGYIFGVTHAFVLVEAIHQLAKEQEKNASLKKPEKSEGNETNDIIRTIEHAGPTVLNYDTNPSA